VDGEKGFSFGRKFVVSLRLGGDTRWFILVASLGLSSGLEHGGHQILGLNSQSYVAPNTELWVEGYQRGYWRGQR
jgi:hypothetical protein